MSGFNMVWVLKVTQWNVSLLTELPPPNFLRLYEAKLGHPLCPPPNIAKVLKLINGSRENITDEKVYVFFITGKFYGKEKSIISVRWGFEFKYRFAEKP